jgi:hypothetical protein
MPAARLGNRCLGHLDLGIGFFGGVATLIALDKLTNRLGWFGLAAAIALAMTVGWIAGSMRRRPVVHALAAMLGWIVMSTLGARELRRTIRNAHPSSTTRSSLA